MGLHRYQVLGTDYDGTIATHGVADDATIAALERLRQSGRQAVLVAGRELEDLLDIFPQCHRVVLGAASDDRAR